MPRATATPKPPAEAGPAKAKRPAAFPTVDVLEGRIATGSRNQAEVANIPLTGQPEPMTTRWINAGIDGRFWDITERKGWVPVKISEIAGGMVGELREVDGMVAKGERGELRLVKMPTRYWTRILQSRAEAEDRRNKSAKHLRQRTRQSLEAEASSGIARERAEQLERVDESLEDLRVEEFNVGKEIVDINRDRDDQEPAD